MATKTLNTYRIPEVILIQVEDRVNKPISHTKPPTYNVFTLKDKIVCILPVAELKKKVARYLGVKSIDDFTLIHQTIRLRGGLLCDYSIQTDTKLIAIPRNNLEEQKGYIMAYPLIENNEKY